MKRLWRAAAVALSLLAIGPSTALGAVDRFTERFSEPYDQLLEVPCANDGAGEIVHVTGTLTTIVQIIDNGNHLAINVHTHSTGLTGVSLIDGSLYHGALVGMNHEYQSFVNGQAGGTRVIHITLGGPSGQLSFRVILHVTANADGTITSTFEKLSPLC